MPKEVRCSFNSVSPIKRLTMRVHQCGVVGDEGVLLPPTMNLTSERLDRHGLHLIEDGQNMFIWLGRAAVPALVNDAFGLSSYEEVRVGKVSVSGIAPAVSI